MILKLNNLVVSCIIGDLPYERKSPQNLSVDVELTIDNKVAQSDDLSNGIDYAELAKLIDKTLVQSKCRLIETAAKKVLELCLQNKKARHVKVVVTKVGAIENLHSASSIAEGSNEFPEYELAGIETIARGVCIVDGRLLLCRAKGGNSTYLPGGHIEFGETGRIALAREMSEEAGQKVTVGKFLGCLENSFLQHGKPHSEINLIYEMTLQSNDVQSKEDHIQFEWCEVSKLSDANLLPTEFQKLKDLSPIFFSL